MKVENRMMRCKVRPAYPRNPETNLNYENMEGEDEELMQPFWTPYYLEGAKTINWETKKEARAFPACLYKVIS